MDFRKLHNLNEENITEKKRAQLLEIFVEKLGLVLKLDEYLAADRAVDKSQGKCVELEQMHSLSLISENICKETPWEE